MSTVIDDLVGPRLDGRSGEDQTRARLIVITSLLGAAVACIFAVLVLAMHWGLEFMPSFAVGAIIFGANVWLVRATARLDLAAMTLCVTLLAGVVDVCWIAGGLDHPALAWTVLIPLYAPLVMRPMLAISCVALVIANIAIQFLAEHFGHDFPDLPAGRSMIVSSQILLTIFVAALAWIYERSRRRALAERDVAIASLEDSRDARIALVENVEAVIFSVDRELRLIAGNSLFDALSHERGKPPVRPGEPALDGLDVTQHADLKALFARAFAGEHFAVERRLQLRSKTFECEILFNPIRRGSGEIRGITVFGRDIGERKRARQELDRVNRELAQAAHLAGKAEVATDVLHNVGNALAALNSSTSLVTEHLQASNVTFLRKTVELLPTAPADLAQFLTTDAKGLQVREYLALLADMLEHERADSIVGMERVQRQLEHVKTVIARQQEFARVSNRVEVVPIDDVIAQAIEMQSASFARDGIVVAREIEALPPLTVDRHKLLEIVNNYLANSRDALDVAAAGHKRILIRAFRNSEDKLQIDVVDNGVGIAAAHQSRLFSYGYTTRPNGHGFGLASSLLDARALGGTARARSDGPGTGATFTVEVPFTPPASTSLQEHAA